MQAWRVVSLLLCVLIACANASPTPPQAKPAECVIPQRLPDLVLGIQRHIVPIRAEIRDELAEMTTGGVCTPNIECARVSGEKLEQLAALLRAMGPLRYRSEYVSPHYGFRTITARWAGGTCSFLDGVTQPLDPRDAPKFRAAFDAIVAALLAARDAKGAR